MNPSLRQCHLVRLIAFGALGSASLCAGKLPDPAADTAQTAAEMASVVDLRPTVRQSLGVRSARAVDDRTLEVEIGLSATDAAGNPSSYRIISFDDPTFDYKKFVRPVTAKVATVVEGKGGAGAAFNEFSKKVVTLGLGEPMKPGKSYHLVAQGTDATMVTAARTAAPVKKAGDGPDRDPAIDSAVLGLRRIEPVGNGVLLGEFGPAFSTDHGTDPLRYKVTVNGTPRDITGIGRLSRVDAYLPVGWPFKAIPVHEIFLRLGTPFQDGDLIKLVVDESVTGGTRAAALDFRDAVTFSPSIKVNQVGYLTNSPVKVAYLGRWFGKFPMNPAAGKGEGSEEGFWQALKSASKKPESTETPIPSEDRPATSDGGPALYFSDPPKFQIRSAADRGVVFEGASRLVHRSGERSEGLQKLDYSGENVYQLDFSDFKVPGRYFLTVAGVGRSPEFSIGDDVFEQAFQVQSYGVMAQRSGFELEAPYSDWRRVASLTKGVIPTTLPRSVGERDAFRDLPKHIDRKLAGAFQMPPDMVRLNEDPELLAWWPMNGSAVDASGHGHDLAAIEGTPEFSPAPEMMPGENKAYGPTKGGVTNGFAMASAQLADATGLSYSFWVKVPNNAIKYDGVVMGGENANNNAAKFQVTASWGVLRGFAGLRGEPVLIGRLNDGEWHHVALVLDREDGGNGQLTAYVDGAETSSQPAGPGMPVDGRFVIAGISGNEAAGKFFDDFRIYRRALEPSEVGLLARKWGEASSAIATSGGHHDAGDYNPRSHIDVAQILMRAYEMEPQKFRDGELRMPEAGNGIPDLLDEAAWALKLWPALQMDDGAVRGGTESNGDPNFITTVELDTLGDFAYAPDAETSFEFAGTFAQASRIWRSLGKTAQADEWLALAEKAYRWADAHRPESSGSPGELAKRYLSPKAYAAAELLHTTRDPRYNADFLEVAVWKRQPEAEPDVWNLYDQQAAAWAYLQCPPELCEPEVREAIRKAIIRRADDYIALCGTLAYKSYRHPYAPIVWGAAAYPNAIDPVLWSYKLTGDQKYLEWIIRSVDNSLGTNPLGRSYVTGLGDRTVRAPLHNSRYSHFGEVVPGMHVQGPNQRGEGYAVKETAFPPIQEDFASLYTYADAHFAISMNEGTIPSQARMMALFGLLRPTPNQPSAKP